MRTGGEDDRGGARRPLWQATLVLTCVQAMAFFHRTLVTLFVEPIKLEYGVSDTLIGILIGAAFSFSFVLAAMPLGILADRSDRFRLLSISVAVWSCLTSLSAIATGFIGLLACRIGIAAAISGVTPSAGSLIADLYSRDRMAKPLGFYTSGIHMGVGLALFGGALLAHFIDPFTAHRAGPLGMLSGWKLIFLIAGVPGLLLAAVLLLFKDPARPATPAAAPAVAGTFDHLSGNARTYATLIPGIALLIFVSTAIGAWMPTLFLRKFGWAPAEIGLWHGAVVVAAGFLGAVGSGYVVAAMGRQRRIDPQLGVLLLAALLTVPVATAMPLVSSPALCLALYFVRSVLGGIIVAIGYGLILRHAPSSQRARVSALAGIAFNIIGGGAGPVSVALVTDHLFGQPQDLPWSLALVSGAASALALLLLSTLGKRLKPSA